MVLRGYGEANRSGDKCREMIVCYSSLREGRPRHAGSLEEAPGSVKGQRDRGGNVGKSISMVSRRELVRQGKRAQDGQVEWLERLWGAGAISSGLPPRPGW